jgi:hypothetical protein
MIETTLRWGCEANPRFETGGILGMLNGRIEREKASHRLFDEARLDMGSIADWRQTGFWMRVEEDSANSG